MLGANHKDFEEEDCPGDWKYFKGKCYLFARKKVSWKEAKVECHQRAYAFGKRVVILNL